MTLHNLPPTKLKEIVSDMRREGTVHREKSSQLN
jgi:hypothetical protein